MRLSVSVCEAKSARKKGCWLAGGWWWVWLLLVWWLVVVWLLVAGWLLFGGWLDGLFAAVHVGIGDSRLRLTVSTQNRKTLVARLLGMFCKRLFSKELPKHGFYELLMSIDVSKFY